MLKLIRESDKDEFTPLSSYHMKTVLLHECRRNPAGETWAHENLGQRVLQLLRDLIMVLEARELPHFFIRECNLFRHYPAEQLTVTAAKLRDIYQDVSTSPADSIRLQC